MKIRDRYDWIVIGEEPAGLLAAAMAARLGLSVLVLQAGRAVFPRVTPNGLIFDPESNLFPAMGHLGGRSNLLRTLFQSVSDGLSLDREVRNDVGVTQIMTSRLRLLYGGTNDFLEKELSRELPSEFLERTRWLEAVRLIERHAYGFWRRFPQRFDVHSAGEKTLRSVPGAEPGKSRFVPDDFADWGRSVRKQLIGRESDLFRAFPVSAGNHFPAGSHDELASGGWIHEEDLQEMMGGILDATFGPCDFESLASGTRILGLALARTGAGFKGGAHGLRKWLRNSAERLGVHLPVRRECRRIFLNQGKLLGVQMEQRGSVITCDGILLACATDEVRPLFSEGAAAVPVRFREKVNPVAWKLTVALSLDRAGVPSTLPSRGWISEPPAPGIEFEQIRSTEYSGQHRPEVMINLRTSVPVSLGPNAFDPNELRRISMRMFRKFSEAFPGIDRHLLHAYPSFTDSQSLNDFASLYPFRSIEEVPGALRLYSCHFEGMGSQSGLGTILLANRESYPEFGSLGPYVAAVESVAWLAHRAGLGGPLAEPGRSVESLTPEGSD